ncbi:MAG: hypothetical protein KGI57_11280, partial [Hyphomicrobiales bacterium]|nr:hypothetical protein [Hyphomicrobiales bacterium]
PGFAALLARADVPEALRGALAAGAQAVRETRGEPAGALDAEATSRAVELAEAASPPVGPRAIALLRRLELEALREAARAPDFEEPAPLELFAPASATSVAGDAFDALDFALVAEREAADEAPPSVAWTPVEVVAGEDEPAAVDAPSMFEETLGEDALRSVFEAIAREIAADNDDEPASAVA